MAPLRRFVQRMAALLRPGRAEQDLAREVASHLALLEDEYLSRGLAPGEARRQARLALGGIDQTKERHRDARSFAWLEDVRRDVPYAVRGLQRSPGFTLAAILTLAVGIGATTAIYSVVDSVLLQPLPFPDADQLVTIREPERVRTMPGTNYQEFLEWRARTATLSGLAAWMFNPQVIMPTREGTARLTGGMVSPNYFEVLGAGAMLGRTLVSGDEANPDVVLLSHYTWRTYFRSDPAVVGSVIELRGHLTGPSNYDAQSSDAGRLLTIVGVLPDLLDQISPSVDFYTPMVFAPGARAPGVTLTGRLSDGISMTAASAEADLIGSAVRAPRPATAPPLTKPRFHVESLKDGVVASIRPALGVLLAAVAVVLLIVCANVANLLLARGSARHREIAVRLAIGASRGRIVRQLLTESLVLALTGGVLGAVLGAAGVVAIKDLATIDAQGVFRLSFGGHILPRINEVGVDGRVLAAALGLAAVTSIVFGLLPALQLSRTKHLQAMGSRGSGTNRRVVRARTLLVVGQLVLATVLLVSAGLLTNSFVNLSAVEKGYEPSNALAFQLVLPAEYSTARKAETIESLLARLRALPDAEAAGFAYAGILLGLEDTVGTFVPHGRTIEEIRDLPGTPRLKSVSQGYLDAMGVRVLDGRGIDGQDGATAPVAIVVNQTVARRYFGETSPVGASMIWHMEHLPVPVQIVGVVEDVRQGPVARPPYAEIFMDYRQVLQVQQQAGTRKATQEQLAFGFLSFGLRTRGNPAAAIPAVREAVRAADANAGIDAIAPMQQMVAHSVARQRFYAVMLGIFAVVAGLLAAIGIYGVLAYAVVQRTPEIGVRMALGARSGQVLRLILGRGMVLAAIGILLGLAGAAALSQYLSGLLFGLTPLDPWTYGMVAGGFAAVAVAASYLPARRATRVDPVVALRCE